MLSTSSPRPPQSAGWQKAGLLYHRLSYYFRATFGTQVRKLSVDAGLSCPNRDGTLGTAGCVFCDPAAFSPSRRRMVQPVGQQIGAGIARLKQRYRAERFIAYFQPATNTYAPLCHLRRVYEEAQTHPDIVGLAVGTRPDCVPDGVLDLLAELSGITWLSLELGLQSIHNRTLDWIGRGHHYDAFLDAVERGRRRGLRLGAHVILGLPGESPADMLATAAELARLRIDSVKLHNLHAVRRTPLADMVAAGAVRLPELEEYACRAVDFLEVLPADCVVERLSGDAPPDCLLGPQWCANKSAGRNAIEAEFRRRGTWQGHRAGRP